MTSSQPPRDDAPRGDASQSELARELLTAARNDSPSAASRARALAAVDALPGPTPVADEATQPAPRRWTWLLAAAALLAVAGGLYVRAERTAPTPVAAPAPAVEPAPAPSAEPIPAPSPAPEGEPSAAVAVAPSATATTSATAEPEVVAHHLPRPSPPPAAKPAAGPEPPAKPPAKPPSQGACGCAPDDMMCMMRCSAK